MALSEFEKKKIEKTVRTFVEKHRPPVHTRNKVDLSFRVEGQSVVVGIDAIVEAVLATDCSLESEDNLTA